MVTHFVSILLKYSMSVCIPVLSLVLVSDLWTQGSSLLSLLYSLPCAVGFSVGIIVMKIYDVIKQLHLFTVLDTRIHNFFLVARKMSLLGYLNLVDYQESLILPGYLGHRRLVYRLGYLVKCRVILTKGKNVHGRNLFEIGC